MRYLIRGDEESDPGAQTIDREKCREGRRTEERQADHHEVVNQQAQDEREDQEIVRTEFYTHSPDEKKARGKHRSQDQHRLHQQHLSISPANR